MSIDIQFFVRKLASFAVEAFQPTIEIQFMDRAPASLKKKHFRAKFTGRKIFAKPGGQEEYHELCFGSNSRDVPVGDLLFLQRFYRDKDGTLAVSYSCRELRSGRILHSYPVRIIGNIPKSPSTVLSKTTGTLQQQVA